jgi:hypothetical protein
VAATPRAGRHAGDLLERAAERRLGVVADLERGDGDLPHPFREQAGRDLHAPARQVLNRGMPHEVGEAVRQDRARRADVPGEAIQGPGMRGPLVEERERVPDDRVPQAREPPRLLRRQRRQMAAHHLDEHQLAETQTHAVPSGPGLARFGQGEVDQLAERIVGGPEVPTQVEQGREGGQQGIEGPHVAAQEPAHQAEPLRARAALADDERQPSGGHLPHEGHDLVEAGPAARAGRGRHGVRVAAREHEDVTCLDPHGRLPDHAAPAGPLPHDVVRDDVLRTRQHRRRQGLAVGERDAPGR